MFNYKTDLKGGKAFGRDTLKVSVKLELFKRRYGLFSKSMGNAFIPFSGLQGMITYDGVSDMIYKGEAVHIHYKLEVKRLIEKKITIKQYVLERKFPLFDIKKSEEMPSNLLPPSPQTQAQPAEKPQASKPQPPKEEPIKAQPVKVEPKNSKPQPMDEEEPAAPQEASSGLSHPLAGDLKILPKAEYTAYLGQLKAVKPAIEKQGLKMDNLVYFEKSSFSCKFLTIYIERLEKQQEDFINGKTVDTESVNKCRDLILELTKRKGQIERNVESGKLQPSEYQECLKNEFDGLLGEAKFVKKFVKNPHVLKFLFAKAQIVDSEIKELDEFLKNA